MVDLNVKPMYADSRSLLESHSMQTIVVGGGCFWCTEAVFTQLAGVLAVESGYCNGHVINPSYEDICTGDTGHAEVIKVTFDETKLDLSTLLNVFFATHDPTTLNRQGNDVGSQYRSGIYYETQMQQQTAQSVKAALQTEGIFDAPIVTEIQALNNYSCAEGYHQRYFEQHPGQGYCAAIIAPKVAKFRKQFTALLSL